jgi:hypothetical protein
MSVLDMQFAIPISPFAPSSRYAGLEIAKIDLGDGVINAYVRRRFVPAPERLAAINEHVVIQGERLDHIAARFIGDPQLFWRVCDGNRAMRPDELTETAGRRLVITLPEGVPGMPNA